MEEILRQIDEAMASVKENTGNPTRLLEIANTLSTLTYNLSPIVADAISESNLAEAQWKDAEQDAYLALVKNGTSQGTASIQAKVDTRIQRDTALAKESLVVKLRLLREDVGRKISLLQSYASDQRSQRDFRGTL